MDAVIRTATAGEVVPIKVAGLGVPKVPTDGPKVKYDGVDEEKEAPLLNIKEEKLEKEEAVLDLGKKEKDQEQEAPVLDTKEKKDQEQEAPVLDDNKVSGWNTETGNSIRQDQKLSQEKKAELSAAKKGLGFFCYGSHGAVKPKF